MVGVFVMLVKMTVVIAVVVLVIMLVGSQADNEPNNNDTDKQHQCLDVTLAAWFLVNVWNNIACCDIDKESSGDRYQECRVKVQ